MTKTSIMSAQVNDFKLNWDEDTSRVPRPCKSCKKPTTGRVLRAALCLTCAIRNCFEKVNP